MTPLEINVEIAKACGLTRHDEGYQMPEGWVYRFVWKRDGKIVYTADSFLPDYAGSLDAMHEAVKTLCGDNANGFLRELQIVCNEHEMEEWLWASVNATAPQRAAAFLRTLGKWREA